MGSFRQEPYLWVHLAGLATVPLWLDLCLVGLATGIPRVPPIFELALLVLLGSGPILWMQWRRPFSIFSLLVLVLPPDLLTEDQRRILRLFKSPTTKALSLLVPLGLTWTLLQLYRLAPIAASVTPLHTGHTVGFLVALISFLACNLFIQVPLSVLRVLAVGSKRFALVDPYPVEEIPQDFTMLGMRVNKILPEIGTVIQPEAVDGADAATAEDPEAEESATVESKPEEPGAEPGAEDLGAAEAAEAADGSSSLAAGSESEAGSEGDLEAESSENDSANSAALADEQTQEEGAEVSADLAVDLDNEGLGDASQEDDAAEEDFGDDPDEDLDADFGDGTVTAAEGRGIEAVENAADLETTESDESSHSDDSDDSSTEAEADKAT